ncbi:hypothetical protein [Flavobacterium hiemivividum]|uniref:Uncharacterized protein n=1 Tax=Flavobacterium hiemivividum TaxID=2541734 RepID=A0A4V2Z158_9FLAO|nr:hypothetical protein [Flavobacterium hiemivividum]TDE03738.1 hypothetical protein E0F98_09525 [Flavobacterium hiemivividum]
MKQIRLTKLNIVALKNSELEMIVAGTSTLLIISDNTDVNTTSGDSYTRDNSESTDSHSHDSTGKVYYPF